MRIFPFLISAFCAGVLILQSYAQPMSDPAAKPSEQVRVLAAEDEYVAAEVSRDEAALRRLVDDRFVFNRSQGTTTGKEELIQGVLKMNMVGQTVRERSVCERRCEHRPKRADKISTSGGG